MNAVERELYERALHKWGYGAQRDMLLEEMAELQVAILHSCRNNRSTDPRAIVEELVDVQIMIDQMIVSYDCQETFNLIKQAKKAKLRALVNE